MQGAGSQTPKPDRGLCSLERLCIAATQPTPSRDRYATAHPLDSTRLNIRDSLAFSAPSMEGTTERSPCWECRRRRLVCDFVRPRCRKCESRGVACPGYGGKKPLRWLPPQQVNSKGPEKTVVPGTLTPASEPPMRAVFEAIEYCEPARRLLQTHADWQTMCISPLI